MEGGDGLYYRVMSKAIHGVWSLCVAACLALGGCADDQAPRILWASFPPDTTDQVGPYSAEAVVEDDCCLDRVELVLTEDPDADADRLEMEALGEGHHGVSFGGFPAGTVMFLAVEARDAHGNWARYPEPADQPELDCVLGADQRCWVRFEVSQ